jgi:hypothetical protein
MLGEAGDRLAAIHRGQVRRDPWPDCDAFEPATYPIELRRAAAVQWAGRARNEHGSVHQFSALTHALTEARAPLHLLGALARLITDEVRHVELCAQVALTLWPEGPALEPRVFRLDVPRAPWQDAPRPDPVQGDPGAILSWAADVVITACCLGETLSRPMLEAIAEVATDRLPEAAARQILRDEHLHAAFGWEVAAYLLPRLDEAGRQAVEARLPGHLAAFERATCGNLRVEDLAGREVVVQPGDPAHPNLGTLSELEYAAIFYSTIEREVFPGLVEVGLDPARAWAERGHTRTAD